MRVVRLDELVEILGAQAPPTTRVLASGNAAAPAMLLKAADAALPIFRLFMLNAPVDIPNRPGIVFETSFVGPGMRGSAALSYFPCRLSAVPRLIASCTPPDVVLLNTSHPRAGRVSLGVEVNVLPSAIETARARGGIVIAQLNASMPYTYGDGEISSDDIDFAVETDEPLLNHHPRKQTDSSRAIGAVIADLVTNRSTIQAGIGAVPDAALTALSNHRGLRVFTEMIGDGIRDLAETGSLANDPIVTSFAWGSDDLYEWLHENERVLFRRTEVTNDLGLIAAHSGMTSINGAIQVDLHGQVNAAYVRDQVYSGLGGQSDYVEGALHAPSGRAIVALPSWHEPSNSSSIVPRLTAPVTSFQPTHVVTERGCAPIWGKSEATQRAALCRVADPRAHQGLQ